MAIDYKKAGVDVAAGDALVDWLRDSEAKSSPHQDRVVSGIGGFAALFRGDFPDLKEPLLVSCTDGVGTKVKLASEFKRFREVAQDMVAMCVNDLICSGARPLFFLDYYACGQLDLASAQQFLAGVRAACHESDCALIGGETAEMPGVYARGDFDCAGFSVGVVDRSKVLGAHRVKVGDRLIGVASSGFHSNGFSLLRKVFAEDLAAWADRLLVPTALYVRLAQKVLATGGVNAMAHITGGGLDNLPRILPQGVRAAVKAWPAPEAFREVQRRSGLKWSEMLTTLNCGIGLVIVAAPEQAKAIEQAVLEVGHQALDLGQVVNHPDGAGREPDWSIDADGLGS